MIFIVIAEENERESLESLAATIVVYLFGHVLHKGLNWRSSSALLKLYSRNIMKIYIIHDQI